MKAVPLCSFIKKPLYLIRCRFDGIVGKPCQSPSNHHIFFRPIASDMSAGDYNLLDQVIIDSLTGDHRYTFRGGSAFIGVARGAGEAEGMKETFRPTAMDSE